MWRWFTYEEEKEEESDMETRMEKSGNGERTRVVGARSPTSTPGRGRGARRSDRGMAPTYDELDPAVTAAILTQAAFRGYRLRERLRRLPAREAEKQIKALHRNTKGFRRVGLFLTFFGLYIALVFYRVDVSFERSVQQSLRDHLARVKYGPDSDKTHHDVSSLADLHQWLQAFYLKTYDGTELEHPCMACAVKPPDDVCDACDFELYDAQNTDQWWESSSANGFGASDGGASDGDAMASSSRRNLATFSGSGVGTGSTSTSSTSSTTFGLAGDCELCLIGRLCAGNYLSACEAALGVSSNSTSSSASSSAADAAFMSNTSVGLPSSSSSSSSSAAAAVAETAAAANFSTLLDALDLEPIGGVRASGGYLSIENASQCYSFHDDVGRTKSLARIEFDLQFGYTGKGYVANRNRIVGGMLVTFTRRKQLSLDQCESSRDYYDVCLADENNETTIRPPEDVWKVFRPSTELVYSDSASGYPVLIDTGGFNVGLNFGYCTLLLIEELDVIPPDEVRSVTLQLITYNGNQQSAYGSINIDFDFEHGGEVVTKELISSYTLKGIAEQENERTRWILYLIFACMAVAMVRHDIRKWYRVRRSKAKRNRFQCCCGCIFFVLIFANILMWLGWAGLGATITLDTQVQDPSSDDALIEQVTGQVLALQEAALVSAAYDILFLLTTMAGLYRWVAQMLTFHKRMSIVTDTLNRASTHLDHFLFVFFLVILVFSALTWLLVGSSTEEFSSLDRAWASVTRISLGEGENFYPQILAAQPTVGPVVVVIYQVLGIVLLLNVVIAILLEAYSGVVGGMRGEDTIWQSLVAFVAMTLCSTIIRLRWAAAWIRWRFSRIAPAIPQERRQRRPSLKVFLQGSTGVYGVDGRPVVMVRKPRDSSDMVDRQLSFNCPRYISVTEMQDLIKATPVPTSVAHRLVRKVVYEWVFHSEEKLTGEYLTRSSLSSSTSSGNRVSANANGNGNPPLIRRVSYTDSSPPLLRRQSSSRLSL